jgi:2-keto-4-pentenoate hydratase/2-oxohepta-3-ene-1,7-dioic acid hydratase in catechol pathway
MRLCRYDDDRLGLVEGDEIADVTAVLDLLPAVRWPVPPGDLMIANLDRLRPAIESLAPGAARTPLADATLKSPVANPGKIIAAPVNYTAHLEESRADTGINFGTHIRTIDEYGVFLKAGSSLVGPSEGVVSDWPERRIDHELELAVVIGRGGRHIAQADALAHVAGYALGLDMSVRGTEDRSFRKSRDTFTVLGPWLVTADEVPDPGRLDFRLEVNGEVRQQSNTALLIFGVERLIAYASAAYTLHPGDIILTGTPEGVAPVVPGDVMSCWIDKVGAMDVAVRAP